MTQATIQGYNDGIKTNTIPKLGNLVWYSISGVKVEHAKLKELIEGTFLEGTEPPKPKDADTFRRICSNAERKKLETGDPEIFKNILIRTASAPNEDLIVRRIVVEVVTPSNKRLDYFQTIDVSFNKKTTAITFTVHKWDPIAQDIANEIKAEFYSWRGNLNSYAVREWIRNAIIQMKATHVKPTGGIYFVSDSHESQLEELEKLVANLGTSSVHYLPLVDTGKQRDMLKAAFESESIGEIDELLAEISAICQDPTKKITEKAYEQMMDRFDHLGDKLDDYNGILKTNLGQVDARLQLFEHGLRKLQPHIKKTKTKVRAANDD